MASPADSAGSFGSSSTGKSSTTAVPSAVVLTPKKLMLGEPKDEDQSPPSDMSSNDKELKHLSSNKRVCRSAKSTEESVDTTEASEETESTVVDTRRYLSQFIIYSPQITRDQRPMSLKSFTTTDEIFTGWLPKSTLVEREDFSWDRCEPSDPFQHKVGHLTLDDEVLMAGEFVILKNTTVARILHVYGSRMSGSVHLRCNVYINANDKGIAQSDSKQVRHGH